MRLGGPIYSKMKSPDSWVAEVQGAGYRAAYCPVSIDADEQTIDAYAKAAQTADIVIAEVGAWSNPLSSDMAVANAALEKCKASLLLAERIGACCCVNIAGSIGQKWDGPDAGDLTPETFERIVTTVREIIDAIEPTRTFYTLETMPWMYPDSVESYLQLIKAIDRKAFAVHLDPVNLISSPQLYFGQKQLLDKCFSVLGEHIKACHIKDIILRDNLTVHLDEVRPGLGGFDTKTFLHYMNSLSPDIPVMLEHLPGEEDYRLAAEHVRAVARQENISL